ncbi:MAG TPA: lytic transglycosylase domain-containing protein [Gemmatimonadaceae bacterium]|nr:lytic transglycosylase domain-containing protein [Gemmatimonadaceae bacterium]
MKKSLTPLDAPPPTLASPFRNALRVAAQAVALAGLLVGGAVWTIDQHQPLYANPGKLIKLPVAVVHAMRPSEEAYRMASVISGYTKDRGLAFQIADALVSIGRKENLDPTLLLGIMVTESRFNPRAKSFVGARGLMQVMPVHAGGWGCGSRDLFDVETNICHGVAVLKQAVKDAPNMRSALLRYNGCVRSTNTPNCHRYDDIVLREADRAAQAMRLVRAQVTE